MAFCTAAGDVDGASAVTGVCFLDKHLCFNRSIDTQMHIVIYELQR